jgi:hypothetical protein
VNLSREQLEAVVGQPAVQALWALPHALMARGAVRQDGSVRAGTASSGGGGGVLSGGGAGGGSDSGGGGGGGGSAFGRVGIFVRRYSAATRPFIPFHCDAAAFTANVALGAEARGAEARGEGERGERGERDERGEKRERDDGSNAATCSFAGGALLALHGGRVRALARRKGEATVHPSSLMHGVARMVSGTRHSMVIFFHR